VLTDGAPIPVPVNMSNMPVTVAVELLTTNHVST
jgi:hypothetical protein